MGNCQAIDAAALVIQHPCGRLERLYWSITASEVMRSNPGHYVSIIIPIPNSHEHEDDDCKKVRFTRVKLLRPTETLTLGHAYRLITSQDVMKVVIAKKCAKMKKLHQNLPMQQQEDESSQMVVSFKLQEETAAGETSETEHTNQERNRGRTAPLNSGAPSRTKSWQPTLQSIDEIAS